MLLPDLLITTVLLATAFSPSAPGQNERAPADANIHSRGDLNNSRFRFEHNKIGHVAFMGGSITEMNGYRPIVCENLVKRFPDTKFTFTNAGIASTCSTTGAFRLTADVLDKGPVDLLFVEFAVNDDQDAHHARRECIRGLEGIVRHVRTSNPKADIVVIYFLNPEMLKTIDDGQVPVSIASHEEVARHYGVPAINLAKEVADRIKSGKLTWKEYGGVHPGRPGNELCASLIEELLNAAWRGPRPERSVAHPLPMDPLDAGHYGDGRFIDPNRAKLSGAWTLAKPDWKNIPGNWRDRFRDVSILSAVEPGSELTLQFEGRAVGAYLLAGPDAGMVETSIDGAAALKGDLFHPYSKALHYPRTIMFATDLKTGAHVLKLKLAAEHNPSSTGTALRILQFVAN